MQAAPILLSILAGVLGGILAASLIYRRHVASMRRLLERLEELARPHEAPAPGPLGADGPDQVESTEATTGSFGAVTGDVLAGRTTHVKELLEKSGVQGLPLADQAIVQVYAHMEESYSPSELAENLNVSLRSLERGLALALDCTPRELILAVKMREARRLLEEGQLNVTAVAYRLGFSSPSHFSRRFRAFYKASPSDVASRAA